MKTINTQLSFFITLAQAYAKINQAFDKHLIGGLGFNDLIILYYLSQTPDEKMRRIDLADKIGITPSGITRMLVPMERQGLIKRELNKEDARVSYVKLTSGGKRLLEETIEEAEFLAEEILPSTKLDNLKNINEIFSLFYLGKIH